MSGKPNLPDDLQMSIKLALQSHVGAARAISKENLAKAVLGEYTTTTDRQVREAISLLQNGRNKAGEEIQVELIVSDLVKGGYFYVETDEEFEAYMADNESRIRRLVEKRNAMNRAYWQKTRRKPNPMQERMF